MYSHGMFFSDIEKNDTTYRGNNIKSILDNFKKLLFLVIAYTKLLKTCRCVTRLLFYLKTRFARIHFTKTVIKTK